MKTSDKKTRLHRIRMITLNLLLASAIITGTIGHLIAGYTFSDSLFSTFLMFAVNYTLDPVNPLINIARYLAAFFTFGAVLTIINGAFRLMSDRLRGRRHGSIFVFGNNDASDEVVRQGSNTIDGKNGFIDAAIYILLGRERENLEFFSQYRRQISKKKVYMRTQTLPGIMVNNENLKSFCIEELAAQKFWTSHSLVDQAYDEDGNPQHLSVAIIGFDKLGEELLFYGLQENAFAYVDWHVFGDTHRFEMLHINLDKLHIHMHDDPWYDHADILEEAALIIVAEQEDQLKTMADLFLLSSSWKVVLFTNFPADDTAKSIFLNHRSGTVPKDNLILYDWYTEGGNLNMIMREANIINDEVMQDEDSHFIHSLLRDGWDNMDTFKRYSYLYLLDLKLLYRRLEKVWGDKISEDEVLRILHTRLCNYYWYNNWQFLPDDEGEDPAIDEELSTRRHRSLRPLEELNEAQLGIEKAIVKDIMNIKD